MELEILEFKSKKKNGKRKPEEECFPAFQKQFKRQKLEEQGSSREGESHVQGVVAGRECVSILPKGR